jgi:hypothetical protein
MKAVLRFMRHVASSRVGLFFVVAHMLFIVYEFAQKPGATYADTPCAVEWSSKSFIAGRDYHWAYESTPLKVVSLLDLPALLLGGLTSELLSPLELCSFTRSWVNAILYLVFASIQWLLVGFIVESIYRLLKKWKAGAFKQPAT